MHPFCAFDCSIYNTHLSLITVIMIIAVISVAHLTDKGEHTMLYKINGRVHIKTSGFLAHHTHTHTHTHTHMHARTE